MERLDEWFALCFQSYHLQRGPLSLGQFSLVKWDLAKGEQVFELCDSLKFEETMGSRPCFLFETKKETGFVFKAFVIPPRFSTSRILEAPAFDFVQTINTNQ